MQLLGAFFRLIRWPNLVFIFLTQLLFYYLILVPGARHGLVMPVPVKLVPALFFLLSFASVLIAAAGYIINDYFDLNIDLVNKPDKLVIDRHIRRRSTILW